MFNAIFGCLPGAENTILLWIAFISLAVGAVISLVCFVILLTAKEKAPIQIINAIIILLIGIIFAKRAPLYLGYNCINHAEYALYILMSLYAITTNRVACNYAVIGVKASCKVIAAIFVLLFDRIPIHSDKKHE